jgi:hypothetical protein
VRVMLLGGAKREAGSDVASTRIRPTCAGASNPGLLLLFPHFFHLASTLLT